MPSKRHFVHGALAVDWMLSLLHFLEHLPFMLQAAWGKPKSPHSSWQHIATNSMRYSGFTQITYLSFRKTSRQIAITLGLISEDSVDANDLVFMREIVKRWLVSPLKDLADVHKDEPEKATWLLVFDGVEDPDILNEFWPYDGPGSVLITSRSPFSWTSALPLRPFTSDEATEYLLKITGREASEEARKAVVDVSRRLGGPTSSTNTNGRYHTAQAAFL